MRSLGDDEVLSLSVDAAEVMTDDDLRTIFVEMVVMLRGEFGDDAMPEGFPDEPWDMSREETLAAVRSTHTGSIHLVATHRQGNLVECVDGSHKRAT
jgi:hypothetical protein